MFVLQTVLVLAAIPGVIKGKSNHWVSVLTHYSNEQTHDLDINTKVL